MTFYLSPFSPEKFVSRDGFSRPVPRQPLLILQTQAEYGASSRDSSRFLRRLPFIYTVNRHRVSPRESASTEPVVLNVVPVTGAAFPVIIMDLFLSVSLFPNPLLVQYVRSADTNMDQPGMVANPVRYRLGRNNEYFPVPVRA